MKVTQHEIDGMVYFIYTPATIKSGSLPLLMIHGHGGDHLGLASLAKQLKTTVVIPDLPGFGKSKELAGNHTIENYVKTLRSLIDTLGYKEFAVMGHSLGSAIALTLCAEDSRTQKLILLNPVPEFTRYIQRLIKTLNGVGTKMSPRVATALVNARLYNLASFLLYSRNRGSASHARNYLKAQNSYKYSFRTWSESGESVFFFDHLKMAQLVKIPVLLLHGDKDSLTTLSSIQAFAKVLSAKLVRIPHAGHFLPLENIDEAAQHIQDFIDENPTL